VVIPVTLFLGAILGRTMESTKTFAAEQNARRYKHWAESAEKQLYEQLSSGSEPMVIMEPPLAPRSETELDEELEKMAARRLHARRS
jgi:hypothetical protein